MKNCIETFTGSKHFRINTVAQGVYAAISVPGTGSLGNAAIIDLGDATLVVDTFTTIEAAKDLKIAASQLTGNPISYVMNTHFHTDHTTGNQVFTPEASIISTSATREIMAAFGKNRVEQHILNQESMLQAIKDFEGKIQLETDEKLKKEMQWDSASDREYINSLPDLIYTLPTITFDHQMIIHGSGRTVQLITYGGGHTQSDAFVYLPKERIAVMGDLVLSKHHLVLNDANPNKWLDILEKVESLEIQTIIPGHGEVCSMKELYEAKDYINNVTALVKEAVQAKKDINDIPVPKEYLDWHFTTYFRTNLKKLYELMTQSAE